MNKTTEPPRTSDAIVSQKKSWMVCYFMCITIFSLGLLYSQLHVIFSLPDATHDPNVVIISEFSQYKSIFAYFVPNFITALVVFFFIYQLFEGKNFFKSSDINKTIFYKRTSQGIIRSYTPTFIILYFIINRSNEDALTMINIISVVMILVITQIVCSLFFIRKLVKKDKEANIPDDYVEE